jgi:hypothetical protein
MPDSTPEYAASSAGGPTRLNGWKDIAAYLDRGVRTVQRWEKEFGLPVRRLGPGRSEGVFAFAHEIDVWQESAQAAHALRESQTASTELADQSASDDHSARSYALSARSASGFSIEPSGSHGLGSEFDNRGLKIAVVVLASVMVLAVVWAGWSTWRAFGAPREARSTAAPVGAPASWRVDGDLLVVLDSAGHTCWTRRLPTEMDAGFYARQPQLPAATGGVGDIDHDGRREVWIVVVPAGNDATPATLHLFDEDGTPRWSYQHAGTATFGSVTYAGPWVVYRVFITDAPEGPGAHAIWVSSREVSEFPALLVRLNIATGERVSGPYWSNGWVSAVALLRSPEGPRLLLGVTNNEKKAPGAVVLDAMKITGTAPAELAKYRCTSGPPGAPLAVAVFPKPRRFEMYAGGGTVDTISAGGTTTPVVAMVTYAFTNAGNAASAVFRLDTALRPLQADTADGYMPAYEHLVRAGQIPAFGPLARDPSSELLPIMRWDGAARRYVETPLQAPPK